MAPSSSSACGWSMGSRCQRASESRGPSQGCGVVRLCMADRAGARPHVHSLQTSCGCCRETLGTEPLSGSLQRRETAKAPNSPKRPRCFASLGAGCYGTIRSAHLLSHFLLTREMGPYEPPSHVDSVPSRAPPSSPNRTAWPQPAPCPLTPTLGARERDGLCGPECKADLCSRGESVREVSGFLGSHKCNLALSSAAPP